jgi:hypothetical protein
MNGCKATYWVEVKVPVVNSHAPDVVAGSVGFSELRAAMMLVTSVAAKIPDVPTDTEVDELDDELEVELDVDPVVELEPVLELDVVDVDALPVLAAREAAALTGTVFVSIISTS